MIYHSEQESAQMTPAQQETQLSEYRSYTRRLVESGVFRAGDRLRPTSSATTVRVRNDDTLITDGPFAETKEQLGGYYLVDVDNLDDALKWAAQIPSARTGSIEVRPLVAVHKE